MRDSTGGAVADRIPCLKVKLLLPNWSAGAGGRNQPSPEPGGSNTTMKKVTSPTEILEYFDELYLNHH